MGAEAAAQSPRNLPVLGVENHLMTPYHSSSSPPFLSLFGPRLLHSLVFPPPAASDVLVRPFNALIDFNYVSSEPPSCLM